MIKRICGMFKQLRGECKSFYEKYHVLFLPTIVFFMLSSIPLWAVLLFDNIIGNKQDTSAMVTIGSFVSICIPILVSGMASSKPTLEKGAFKNEWTMNVLAYSLSVILVLAIETIGLDASESKFGLFCALLVAVIVFIVTIIAIGLHYKEKMIADTEVPASRQKDQEDLEREVFQ